MAFAMFHFSLVLGLLLLVVVLSNPSQDFDSGQDFDSIGFRNGGGDGEGIEVDFRLFHQDYSPPAPPPPPPHPPSVLSCVEDLGGVGSLDTTCQIVSDLELTRSVYIEGKGSFYILPNVTVQCVSFGCELAVNVGGNFTMGDGSLIYAGTFELVADNVGLGDGSAVDTTGLAGDPPEHTSGTPGRVDGAGGGYGGRGAACLQDGEKIPEDVWGGDIDGGSKGGGGSGGSIYIKAFKMTGSGRVSASGGTGFGGGGGGRVSVDVFSRHDQPKIYVHGGNSLGCPANAGAAGTFYDAVPRSLLVSNYNRSTFTDTPFYEFPQPHMTNVYIRDFGKATVPLLWSRLQVQGQISLLNCGMLSFGLAHYPMSEFEILAEELLMSDSILRVSKGLNISQGAFDE
ncbi:transmembrane signal receptor [Lithospermum erythrorhizon]|uniref:Transmembrane signal receptor n=1 Tax=Lithospermum erythrorhizon TaxID=34254 RepID=A0AAV3QDU2_LITER